MCKTCKFGGSMKLANGSVYLFASATKKGRTIHYDKGEVGCRMDQWNEKEKNCLINSFSGYVNI